MTRKIPFPLDDFILFLYAFVIRLLFWSGFEDRQLLYSLFYYGDSFRLHQEALEILKTNWNSTLLPYHPPVTSYLLALFYKIFGMPPEHLTAIKIFLIIISALSVVIFHRLARRFFSEKLALIAAIVFAATFPMLVVSVTPNTESIFLCLGMLTLLFFARLKVSWYTKDAILMGLCGALASLTRAEFASFFVVLVVGMFILRPGPRALPPQGRASIAIALMFSFLIPFIPWTIRNYYVLKQFNVEKSEKGLEPLTTFAPITCYGPINFAMANNLLAEGKFTRTILIGANVASLDLNNPQHRHYFLHGYSEGFTFIKDYSQEFLKLIGKKLHLFIQGFSWGFGPTNIPGGLNGVRYPIDIFVSESRWWAWLIGPLFIFGYCLSLREFSKWWPIHLLFLHRIAVTAAFFGYVRGLAAIYFLVVLFLFYPLSINLRFVNWFERVPKQILLIVPILIFTAISLIPHFSPIRFQASGPSEGGSGYLIQDEEIRIWPKQ
ncbi:glycosyltransferase family 39 protein [bacterium]|nr:glycosyltransferase family 39 protein [bacterium]